MPGESSEPRYFGPCLVAPLVLRAQQPEPAAWVPPRDWNPKTAGWDPRITYQGLSDEAKESLTEEFLLFEIPGNEDDDPEDPLVQKSKGHVLLAKLPTLFRSMGRTNKPRNAMCIEQCRLKSVPHPASGATCLHVTEFLKVMDDELRQDAVELAQSDADGLTQRLRDAERAWEATNTPLVAQAAAEAAARDHWTYTAAARARWYGRVDARSPRDIGHAAKMAAARRAAAHNDPQAMRHVLEADRFAVGEHNAAAAAAARLGAAAAEAAHAAGAPPSIAEAEGAAVAGKVGLDPVLLRNVASGGDGEEVSSLHQLALSRHPRERGRVPGAAATTATAAATVPSAAAPPGDAAAALNADLRADFVPAAAAHYHQLPPWQRPRPLPASRAAAVVVRSDRASAYAPYLPPHDFWEDRQSAGLQAKAKAAAHEAKMASRAAAAAAAAANGKNSGDAQEPSRAGAGSEPDEGVDDDDEGEGVKGSENSDKTKVAAASVAGPVRLEIGPAAKGRWPIMTKAEERLRAAKAAAFAARKEAAQVANNSSSNEAQYEKEESKAQSSRNHKSNENKLGKEHGAADKHPLDAKNTSNASINTNNDDDDDDLDDVDRAEQLALAQAQEAAAARQAEEEEARAEAERKKWKTLTPEERLDITETKALAEAQKRAAVQLNEMRQAQDERAWEVMRQRSKVAALNKAVLSGRLQHNLMRLNLRVPGWPDPQDLKNLQKEAQKAEHKDQKKKKKEQDRGDERGSNEDFNLSDDNEDDDEDGDDDDSNETSSTYTARSLSSMTTNTIAQKAARRDEKAKAAALAAELAAAAAAEEEAQRRRDREAALEWLKHTDLHAANVADALVEAEVDRMLEAAVLEAAAERHEARLARAPPKHNPPVWTSKLHLRELGPVNCMALGPGLPLSSPNIDDVDDESDECNRDNSGKIAGDEDEGHKMSKVSELTARNSDNGSRNGRRRRCRDENAAWASADLLAVGRDDEGVSVWNLAGSIDEEVGGSVGGLGGGGRQDRGKDVSLRSSSSHKKNSSHANIKRSGGSVRLASWVSHYGPARTPVPFVAWLPGLPVDYTSPTANVTVNREEVPTRNGAHATTATETAAGRGDSASINPETHLESKTEDTGAAATTAASATRAAAVNSTDAHVAARGATSAALMEKQKVQAAAGVRVARRPALCCGSGDGRVRIFSPLSPKELAINDPAAQELLLVKGRARPAKERAEPYMWTPGVGHAHAAKASTSASNVGDQGALQRKRRGGGGPSEPHGWALVQTVRAHSTAVTCGALSLDNQWLATGSAGGLTRSHRMAGATPLLRVWQLSPRDIAYEEAWLRQQKSVDAARAAAETSSGNRRAISDQPRVRVDPITGAVDVWWPPSSTSSFSSSSGNAGFSQPSAETSAEATATKESGKVSEESSNSEGNNANTMGSDRTSSSSCDAVACMGLDGKACVAEGSGHAKALTCILWLPCPVVDYYDNNADNNNADSDGMAPSPQQRSQQRGKLYHIVTGSRDGELRQWCIRLGGPPRRPASRMSTPLAANSREVFPLALTDAICVRVLRAPCVDTTTTAASSSINNDTSIDNSGERHDGPSSSSTEPKGFDQSQSAILSLELLDESASSESTSICNNGSSGGKSTSSDQHDMQNKVNHGGKVADRSSPPTVRVVVGDGLGRVRVWTLRLPRDRQTMEVFPTPESNQDIVDESSFDGSHYSANNNYYKNNEDEQSEPGESQFTSEFEDVAAEEARWREDACWGVGRDPTSAEIEEAAVDEEAAAPASNGSFITATAARACALAEEKLARDVEARRGAGTPWEVANYAPCSIKAAVPLLSPVDRLLRKRRQLLPSDPDLHTHASVNPSKEAVEPLLPSLLMGLSVPFQSSLLNLSTLQGAPLLSPLVRAGLSEADAMLAAVRKVEREQELKALEQAPREGYYRDAREEDLDISAEDETEATSRGGADRKAQEEGEGEDASVRRSSIDSSESNTLASSISLSGSTEEDDAKGVALSGAGSMTTMSVVEGAEWSPMGFWVTKPAPVLKEPKPPAPEVVEAARAALATEANAVAKKDTPVAAGAAGTGSGEVFSDEQNGSEFGLQQQRYVSQQKEVAYYSTAWLGAHDGGLVCVEGEATLSHALRQREVHSNSNRSHDGSNEVLPKGQQGQELEGMRGAMPSKPPRLITGGADWAIHVWVPERPRLVSEPNPAGEKP